jgi:hypothetical protein
MKFNIEKLDYNRQENKKKPDENKQSVLLIKVCLFQI